MDRAIAVVVVADRAVEQVIPEDPVEGLALRNIYSRRFSIDPHASGTRFVAQARTNCPSTSTMQVSQVWMGPNCG